MTARWVSSIVPSMSSLANAARRLSLAAAKCDSSAHPVLAPNDVEAISEGYSARLGSGRMRHVFESKYNRCWRVRISTSRLKVLASLVALGVIEFRVAFMERVPGHERIFHEKLGLVSDDGLATL